jgi:hypothetical protein
MFSAGHYSPAQGDIDKLSARRFLGAATRHAKFFYGSAEARAVSRDIKAHCCRESRPAIDYFLPCRIGRADQTPHYSSLIAAYLYMRFIADLPLAKATTLPRDRSIDR